MTDGQLSLRSLLDKVTLEQNYDNHDVTITPISTGGGNYTSELFLVTIKSETKQDLKLFAKVANIGSTFREEIPITQFYETERFVYEKLVGIYGEIEDKNNVPEEHRLYFPKYYGCNPKLYEETIVLEDLSVRGYTTYDRLKSIDWNYARTAVKELAKIHALSFAYAEENPEEFAKVAEKMLYEIKGPEEKIKLVWGKMVENVVVATKEENRERLESYLKENVTKLRDHWKPLRRTVLTHGDFRPSNLMHKTKEDGNLDIITVDYQTVRTGCVATDLLYLIFTGSDEQFRAQHYEELVEEYYRQLTAALRRLGLDPEMVYSREDFDYELKESLPFGLAVAVFVLPIVTVEAANAPKLGEMDLENWNIDTSQLFPVRVNEIVNDYVKWGVI
ncbi:hypothetical protein MSG28_008986 [Choristoneura fumiferana]|uniref:Uncharacterized protein n=1 Tax=Choristoneura fumiferana TaxID=7141 RepID=A0ACC0J8R8_CHOFU|nr:hypothetical protein MSG28_008986 [Choristoneura fumiferana]